MVNLFLSSLVALPAYQICLNLKISQCLICEVRLRAMDVELIEGLKPLAVDVVGEQMAAP